MIVKSLILKRSFILSLLKTSWFGWYFWTHFIYILYNFVFDAMQPLWRYSVRFVGILYFPNNPVNHSYLHTKYSMIVHVASWCYSYSSHKSFNTRKVNDSKKWLKSGQDDDADENLYLMFWISYNQFYFCIIFQS